MMAAAVPQGGCGPKLPTGSPGIPAPVTGEVFALPLPSPTTPAPVPSSGAPMPPPAAALPAPAPTAAAMVIDSQAGPRSSGPAAALDEPLPATVSAGTDAQPLLDLLRGIAQPADVAGALPAPVASPTLPIDRPATPPRAIDAPLPAVLSSPAPSGAVEAPAVEDARPAGPTPPVVAAALPPGDIVAPPRPVEVLRPVDIPGPALRPASGPVASPHRGSALSPGSRAAIGAASDDESSERTGGTAPHGNRPPSAPDLPMPVAVDAELSDRRGPEPISAPAVTMAPRDLPVHPPTIRISNGAVDEAAPASIRPALPRMPAALRMTGEPGPVDMALPDITPPRAAASPRIVASPPATMPPPVTILPPPALTGPVQPPVAAPVDRATVVAPRDMMPITASAARPIAGSGALSTPAPTSEGSVPFSAPPLPVAPATVPTAGIDPAVAPAAGQVAVRGTRSVTPPGAATNRSPEVATDAAPAMSEGIVPPVAAVTAPTASAPIVPAVPRDGGQAPIPASTEAAAPIQDQAGAADRDTATGPVAATTPILVSAPARSPGEPVVDLANRRWVAQLAEHVAGMIGRDGGARIALAPDRLGALTIALTDTADGVSVRLEVATEAAQDALQRAEARLIADVRAQGGRIADTQVVLAAEAGAAGGHAPADGQGGGRHPAPSPAPMPVPSGPRAPAPEEPHPDDPTDAAAPAARYA